MIYQPVPGVLFVYPLDLGFVGFISEIKTLSSNSSNIQIAHCTINVHC